MKQARSVYSTVTIALAIALVACAKKAPSQIPEEAPSSFPSLTLPVTTDPEIALGNLGAQIEGQTNVFKANPNSPDMGLKLVDLLLMRGQFTGRISDVETADRLSRELVLKLPNSPEAHLARAKTAGAFHRFQEALTELDAAASCGASKDGVASARASVFLALGRYDEIANLGAWQNRADPLSLVSVAVLNAEIGHAAVAEQLFERARTSYRDVSPFAVAFMDFQRGSALERDGQRARAKLYFAEAVRLLPTYAHAVVHLATLTTPQEAIAPLKALVEQSEDPEVLAALGEAERLTGQKDLATSHIDQAKSRYEALLKTHPEAFYDHAASFYLGNGQSPARALELARKNAELRKTEASVDLWLMAAQANKSPDVCAAVEAGERLTHARPTFRTIVKSARAQCVR
jgi:tetratricopeptide (TPR) repeat protein